MKLLPKGEVEGGLSRWSKDSNPDRLSVVILCAVALLPCRPCFADCRERTSVNDIQEY